MESSNKNANVTTKLVSQIYIFNVIRLIIKKNRFKVIS